MKPILYDIYLDSGCTTANIPPSLEGYEFLLEMLPKERIFEKNPGFLGLSEPSHTILKLSECIVENKGKGWIAPTVYREPKFTIDTALLIAKKYLEQVTSKYPEETWMFVERHPVFDTPLTLAFNCQSPSLQEKGFIPGAAMVSIDRVSGYIWQESSKNDTNARKTYLNYVKDTLPEKLDEFFTKVLDNEEGIKYL